MRRVAQRRAAFDNIGLEAPLGTLIEKVAKRAHKVTDEDIAAVRAVGLSEDEIFEIVVCGAVGQAIRQHAGTSTWSVGDRELLAAFISQVNETEFCIKAHSAVAGRAYRDRAKVSAALNDLDTAPISDPLRATLRMVRKLTREHTVEADDMRALLAAGVSRALIEDALAVCLAFNTTDRLADTFAFAVPGPKALEAGAKFLLARGYR